jgi:hypothetical protein
MYSQDNTDKIPYGSYWNFPWAGPYDPSKPYNKTDNYFYGLAIDKYMNNQREVFFCPYDANYGPLVDWAKAHNRFYNGNSSYAYFGNYSDIWQGSVENPNRKTNPDDPRYKYASSLSGDRLKIMQDRRTDDWWNISHDPVSALFTDGSVESLPFRTLTPRQRLVINYW